MLRITFTSVLIVLASGTLFPQQPNPGTTTPACSFSEIYRAEGWTVPGLAGAKVKGQRAKFSNIPGVFVAVLTPVESESTTTDIWCPPDHAGRLEIEEQPMGILNLGHSILQGGYSHTACRMEKRSYITVPAYLSEQLQQSCSTTWMAQVVLR
jgi:hypothetical protein